MNEDFLSNSNTFERIDELEERLEYLESILKYNSLGIGFNCYSFSSSYDLSTQNVISLGTIKPCDTAENISILLTFDTLSNKQITLKLKLDNEVISSNIALADTNYLNGSILAWVNLTESKALTLETSSGAIGNIKNLKLYIKGAILL